MGNKALMCPLCSGHLEVKECAPCMECGGNDIEIGHLRKGEHTYAIYRIFKKYDIALCDFCQADFSSYGPEYFGLAKGRRVGLGREFDYVKDVDDLSVRRDKYCPACRHRLPFLRFIKNARESNAKG